VRAVVVASLALAACGRIGFSTSSAAVTGDGGGVPPSCGDGICQAALGEDCANCADCRTTAAVCGNGACDPGETSASCPTDCGPTPWPLASDEQSLLSDLNFYRIDDACGSVLSALPEDTTLRAIAREWAWEIAHQQFLAADYTRCNGRTLADLEQQTGVFEIHVVAGPATYLDVESTWSSICHDVWQTNPNAFEAGIAADAQTGYVVLFR
jgi:hypothetical protein